MDWSSAGVSFVYANIFVHVSGCVVDGSAVEMIRQLLCSAMSMSCFHTAESFFHIAYTWREIFSRDCLPTTQNQESILVYMEGMSDCVYPDYCPSHSIKILTIGRIYTTIDTNRIEIFWLEKQSHFNLDHTKYPGKYNINIHTIMIKSVSKYKQ